MLCLLFAHADVRVDVKKAGLEASLTLSDRLTTDNDDMYYKIWDIRDTVNATSIELGKLSEEWLNYAGEDFGNTDNEHPEFFEHEWNKIWKKPTTLEEYEKAYEAGLALNDKCSRWFEMIQELQDEAVEADKKLGVLMTYVKRTLPKAITATLDAKAREAKLDGMKEGMKNAMNELKEAEQDIKKGYHRLTKILSDTSAEPAQKRQKKATYAGAGAGAGAGASSSEQ